MHSTTATWAKMHFGQLLDSTIKEPVIIERSGRQIAVIMSYDEYNHLTNIEDKYWLLEAKKASREGYIGTDASESLLNDLLNDED